MSEPTLRPAAELQGTTGATLVPEPAARSAPRGGLLAPARTFLRDARGGTAIEYAMIGGLIFAVVAGTIRIYGSKLDGVYGRIGSAMAQVN